VKLGIKEKRQEKGEEEGYMERKVHIGNKWWKLITNDSKKTCRRCNEIKEGRSFTLGTSTGELEKEEQEIGKRRGGMGKENSKTRWKMERGRD
jgi:hypothetical protein